jgi:oxalate decarboxylase
MAAAATSETVARPDEMHYYLRGTGEVAIFGSGGRHKVAKVQPGDTVYIPAGFGHAIHNTGAEDLEIVQAWNAGEFQEINLTDWMAATPRYTLANNFCVQPQVFADFPAQSDFIRRG